MANATMTVEVRVYGAALLRTLPILALLPAAVAAPIITFVTHWLLWAKVGKHFVRLVPRYEVEL